jgi:hypothetical protein
MNILNVFKSKAKTIRVIEQIHSEFDNASEKLLKEANDLLNSTSGNEMAERLSKLGFVCAAPVKESKKQTEARQEQRSIIGWVEYYRIHYPNNKFITEKMVEAICKKYNLLCGEISRYIGDVPSKNISEMEKFSLRQEDMNVRSAYDDFLRFQMQLQFVDSRRGLLGYANPSPNPNHPSMEKIKSMMEEMRYSKPSLKICAPQKDFETYGARIVGYNLVPDPIVLQPVKGGYLIITKWGLEANDELAINEGQN